MRTLPVALDWTVTRALARAIRRGPLRGRKVGKVRRARYARRSFGRERGIAGRGGAGHVWWRLGYHNTWERYGCTVGIRKRGKRFFGTYGVGLCVFWRLGWAGRDCLGVGVLGAYGVGLCILG